MTAFAIVGGTGAVVALCALVVFGTAKVLTWATLAMRYRAHRCPDRECLVRIVLPDGTLWREVPIVNGVCTVHVNNGQTAEVTQ